MTSHRLRRPVQLVGVVSVAAALLVSGCSSKKNTSSGAVSTPTSGGSSSASAPSSSGSAPSTAGASSQDLSAMLPASIKSSGTINIATDASYAPNEFFDTDGKTIIGMDVDLGNAIAQKLGVKANFQNVTFDNIIPGLAGGKYDLGMSSFTDTKEREQTVDFVTYFSAGESLIVAAGNPKGVTGLPDLLRDDIQFVNRQRGAGTRVLLDFQLRKLGATPDQIHGYEREEYTHLAVAAAVSGGTADTGLGPWLADCGLRHVGGGIAMRRPAQTTSGAASAPTAATAAATAVSTFALASQALG